MSSGTVSYRHEFYTQSEAGGIVAHSIRSLEEAEGVYKNHTNEMIDPARTKFNGVYVFDDGKLRRVDSTKEVYERIASRIGDRNSKKRIRSNQKVLCETIFQLDPGFTGTSVEYLKNQVSNRRVQDTLTVAAMKHITETVGGEDNVAYIAAHWDEKNPHLHIGWVPIAPDGSLDYRKTLGEIRQDSTGRERGTYTPAMMREEHTKLHEMLRDHGYEAVRLHGQRKHLSVAAYKQYTHEKKAQEQAVADLKLEHEQLDNSVLAREAEYEEIADMAHETGYNEGFAHGRKKGADDAQRDRDAAANELVEARRERTAAQQQQAAAQRLQQQAESVLARAHEDAEQVKKDAALSAARTQSEALDKIEPLRDQMLQADSEFLNKLLQDPSIRQQRDEFRKEMKRGYFFKSVQERQRDEDRVRLTVSEYSQKYPAREASRPARGATQRQRDTARDRQFGD